MSSNKANSPTTWTHRIESIYDQTKTKLRLSRHGHDRFSTLPTEIIDQILQYVIPPFIPKIDIAYKHKCHRRTSSRKSFRWKVTGIPEIALDLQLVSREVGLLAKQWMLKQCGGLETNWPINCDCRIYYRGLLKHIEVMYRLRWAFWSGPVQLCPELASLWYCVLYMTVIDKWVQVFQIKDSLYISQRTRDWNVFVAIEHMAPIVIGRSLRAMLDAKGAIEPEDCQSRIYRARIALLIEMHIRFSASEVVSHSAREDCGNQY